MLYLTRSLMFELIIFTEKIVTKAAYEYAASMVPNPTFTFYTYRVLKCTRTSMRSQAFSPMTNPCFTKVTNCTNHGHSCRILSSMFDNAVSSFKHAFSFSAFCTLRKPLYTLAEITKSPIFLFTLTFITFHHGVAW